MTSQPVAVGLVGVANHGKTILNAILEAGNFRLAACYDTDDAALADAVRRTGAYAARSYEDLLGRAGLQAVALVTPNHLHAAEVEQAAAGGKHIFVEKPIATSVREAKTMVATSRKAGVVLMVGHNTRRRKVFRRAREILAEGSLGKIVGVEGNLSRPAGLEPGLPSWKADRRKCPLLPMTQLGIHLVDTVEYLLGPIRSVSCVATNVAMAGGVDDATAALLQLSSGIPFALSSYYVSPDAYFLRIYGTCGILTCLPTRLTLELTLPGKPTESHAEDFPDEGAWSYILQMREFGECVLTGRRPETAAEEGLRALAVIQAMTRSAERAEIVDINRVLNDESL